MFIKWIVNCQGLATGISALSNKLEDNDPLSQSHLQSLTLHWIQPPANSPGKQQSSCQMLQSLHRAGRVIQSAWLLTPGCPGTTEGGIPGGREQTADSFSLFLVLLQLTNYLDTKCLEMMVKTQPLGRSWTNLNPTREHGVTRYQHGTHRGKQRVHSTDRCPSGSQRESIQE